MANADNEGEEKEKQATTKRERKGYGHLGCENARTNTVASSARAEPCLTLPKQVPKPGKVRYFTRYPISVVS